MKPIHIIIAALLLCSTIAAMGDTQPYGIQVIVWDTDGNREADVAVTFAYDGMTKILYTAEDGTTSFGIHNFGEVPDGAHISVSCKYGTTEEVVNYNYGASGTTFNEPSQSAAIAAFTAMGFAVVIALGGGRYYMRRKKKNIYNRDNNMIENNTETGWKLKRDFGVRAWIASLIVLGYSITLWNAIFQGNIEMIKLIAMIWTPIVMAVVALYFQSSSIRNTLWK